MILQSFYFCRRTWELSQTWNIGLQIRGKLCVGGNEVGGDEVPEGEEGDEGGEEGAGEQQDLVRWELHALAAQSSQCGVWTEDNTAAQY